MPRDSNGTYTLPSGNPVITNTLIASNTWANPTMSDLGNEITNSLDRAGRGGMIGPFGITDGTLSAPGLRFTSDPDNGPRRIGANNWSLVAGAIDVALFTPTTFTIPVGVQLVLLGTTSGLLTPAVAAATYIPLSQKGAASGVAPLDASSLVPLVNLPPIPSTTIQQDAPPAWAKGELWFDSDSGNFALAYQNPDLTQTFVGVNAFGGSYVPNSALGAASGVATLSAAGKVPTSQLAKFVSTDQVITSAGALVIPHGLGVIPTQVFVWLRCLTAEGGYSIGDITMPALGFSNSAVDNKNCGISPDATNLNIRFGSSALVFDVMNKTTGAAFSIANSSWRVFFVALP